MTETRDLLIEIGTEELPPGTLSSLASNFANQILSGLKAAYAAERSGDFSVYCSPRRFAVLIEKLYAFTTAGGGEQLGPPVDAAFDKDGNPTKVAIGFANKYGVNIDDLKRIDTEKGERIYCEFAETEQAVSELIPDIINQALGKLAIPKRMRWGNNDSEFVRPVHWAVVLFGDEVIECDILGVRSGRHTRGHRFHSPGPVAIQSPDKYEKTLREHKVWLNDATHGLQEVISNQAQKLANEINGEPLNCETNSDLVVEIAALVEWPVPLRGEFDPKFLQLPDEVLIATLEDQQRYFPLRDKQSGKLLPAFVTIANIESRDPDIVRRGNERVIVPRLADAMFFWETDRARRLESRIPELDGIVYQKQLGSIGDKSRRVTGLAEAICGLLDTNPVNAKRAAQLAKCDLVTTLVGEFPELQGLIGKYLAVNDNEPEEVAQSIEEHYLPRFAGDRLPESATGQVLALADKLDTLAGIFGVGLQPSGDKDPFALRRAALGMIRIIIEAKLPLSLTHLVDTAYAQHGEKIAEAHSDVCTFIYERARNYFIDKGYSVLEVDSVFCLRPDRLDMVPAQLDAVRSYNTLAEASSLSAANKRIGNILKKTGAVPSGFTKELLTEDAEKQLAEEYLRIAPEIDKLHAEQDFTAMLQKLAVLREPVDRFFDTVMVMTDDEKLRDNRIGLLKELHTLMNRIADLSRLAA